MIKHFLTPKLKTVMEVPQVVNTVQFCCFYPEDPQVDAASGGPTEVGEFQQYRPEQHHHQGEGRLRQIQ